MKEQIEQRLNKLKSKFESGQEMLADLDAQQANLKTPLLRISGAIQVLEEVLSSNQPAETDNGKTHIPEAG